MKSRRIKMGEAQRTRGMLHKSEPDIMKGKEHLETEA
jgi:hypothetical protein